MKTSIWVKTCFQGLHYWPECPHEEVSFLRNKHRHTFHVKVVLSVSHDDRDLEFFQVKDRVDAALDVLYDGYRTKDLGHKSCETIARELWDILEEIHQWSIVSVEISEDGEVGAVLENE